MIRAERAHLHVAALSHPGLKGKNNEDRYAVSSYFLSPQEPTPVLFAIVADGIGGHRAGEVAAELAVDHTCQVISESDARQPLRTLERAIHTASQAVAAHAASAADQQGMGATCACALVIGDHLYMASVGDSRIYLLRAGGIQQLTTDHTWIQEAMDKGILTPEQASEHPNVHVIRRYLGSPQPPRVDFRLRLSEGESDAQAKGNQGMTLRPGDILLLCSDGLTDLAWNDEILQAIRAARGVKAAAKALIDLANERGGHDNITVILLAVPEEGNREKKNRRALLPWMIGSIVGLIALVTGLAGLVWYLRQPTPVSTPGAAAAGPPPLVATTPMPFAPTSPPGMSPGTALPGPTYTPWPTNTP